jgi:hypothetical protein
MEQKKLIEWEDAFKLLGDKLLNYEDNRSKLLEIIREVYNTLKEKYPQKGFNDLTNNTKNPDNIWYDIDPLTFQALLLIYSAEKKNIIINEFLMKFELPYVIQSKYEGVPSVYAQMVWFFYDSNDKKHMDILWEFFRKYRNFPKDEQKENFIELYNKIRNVKGVDKKLSIVLFCINPNEYISLDATMELYFKSIYLLNDEDTKHHKHLDGENYLKLIRRLKKLFTQQDKSIKKTSFEAYNFILNNKKQNKTKKDTTKTIKIDKNKILKKEQNNDYISVEILNLAKGLYNLSNNKVTIFMDSKLKHNVGGEKLDEINATRSMLFKNNIVYNNVFLTDYTFNSPSKAARTIIGYHQSGPESFIVKETNQTLKDYLDNLNNENKAAERFDVVNSINEKEILSKQNIKPLNIILYGPPGTGKTYNTKKIANHIIYSKSAITIEDIRKCIEENNTEIMPEKTFDKLKEDGQFQFCTFHQSYGYEEFVEGIKPKFEEKELKYEIKPGIFKNLCEIARKKENKNKKYVFIIDEINRGNISKIFGELITLIEIDKREDGENAMKIVLPYSQNEFTIPSNIFIIGTMNTADKSIQQIDTALRRRFDFIEMMPNANLLKNIEKESIDLDKLLQAINERINILLDREHQIGHSEFINLKDLQELNRVFKNKIIPLLQEYFYNDYEKIKIVLNDLDENFVQEFKFNENEKTLKLNYYDNDDLKIFKLNDKIFNENEKTLKLNYYDNDDLKIFKLNDKIFNESEKIIVAYQKIYSQNNKKNSQNNKEEEN